MTSGKPRKSIVVPCYNEAGNLPNLIQRFQDLTEGKPVDWELVLVNNGSTDDSAAVFERELQKPGREFVRVVTVPSPNVGYGHGIMTGLRAAHGEYLGWTHADGQTPPKDVLRAFDLLLSSSNPYRTLVKGRRRQRPLKDELFTLGMQATAVALLRENLADINGQPKTFPRALLELAVKPPIDLSLDLYFLWLANQNGYTTRTIDVSFGEREHGESKWAFNWKSKLRNIRRTVDFMNAVKSGRSYPTS
ncbi:MAG TPA: glycosyltransferase family 2 protein [Polyangiales bacterium]